MNKTGAFHQRGGSNIARLNIRFQPMQLQMCKRIAKHQLEGSRHITVTRVRDADKVTEIGTPKSAQEDLAKINRADNLVIFQTTNEETSRIGAATTFEKLGKLRRLGRRRHQAAM